MRRGARSRNAAALVVALLAAACSSGSSGRSGSSSGATTTTASQSIAWPAPADPLARARAAGLVPETSEHLLFHVHAHLDVFVNGQQVTVPAGLGINTRDPGVHLFHIAGADAYGGINPPCDSPCISPLHTHDVTGVIHTESDTAKENTLGQLFVEWGVRLDTTCVSTYCRPAVKVAFYVDGKPSSGDPRKIALADRREIAVVIGTPPARIPDKGDFSSI